MDSPADHAKRLRDRAKECRTVAAILKNPQTKQSYLDMAQAYEQLANHEEAVAERK